MKSSYFAVCALSALVAVLSVGCPPSAPVAAFTATNRIGDAPLDVQFTDQSSVKGGTIQTWLWDFGDGATSTQRNPLHQYPDAGPYSVSLTVTSTGGTDTESKFRYVQADGASEHSLTLPGGVPLTMVWMPSGSFSMGAPDGEAGGSDTERPVHTVSFTQGCWMGKYPITKAQWTAVMGTELWTTSPHVIDDPDSPAVCIAWADTQSFMTAINTLTGKVFRLPTEAEWEYACRAGTTARFYWGDDPTLSEIGGYAWWSGNAADIPGQDFAHVVGLKQPNAWGLYDMNGNVWVWCQDYWVASYPGTGAVIDPTGPASGTDRVVRGGGWYNPYYQTHRSAFRGNQNPTGVYSDYGFRVCTSSSL